MKPILLKVAGLQSYREQQVIDFEQLCETGLFGIFGPTGSGKSSLLDAITLAMYGKVERAVNGTQGIMNHSEDTLSVSFTFELASASGPERYRVERRFKRSNELSVSNTISRFIQIADGEESVIADKLADVTRCVEEKIGLKMDDFTRAVVLPQGKFAEFLSLKGSERRQMLQRLFHLERYGDQLAQKLSRRVKDNDGALKSVEAEQTGLGQAGKEAVAEAEHAVKTAAVQAEHARRQLQTAVERNETMGKIRELDAERSRLKSKLDNLAAREEEIKKLESRLELAGTAGQLLPALESWKESSAKHAALRETAEGLLKRAERSAQEAAQAGEADQAAQKALAEEEPKLLQRSQQLEQAVELQAERNALAAELSALEAQRLEARKVLEHIQEQLCKEQELLDRGQKRREELKESLKQLEIKVQERNQLQEAMQRKQAIAAAENLMAKAEAEAKAQTEKVRLSEAELKEARGREEIVLRELRLLALESGQLREAAEKAAGLAEQGTAAAAGAEQALHEAAREEQLHALSLSLAAELRDGAPCPVCGSLDHPKPALPELDGHSTAAGSGLERVRRLREGLQEQRLVLRQLHSEASALAEDEHTPAGGEDAMPAANEIPAASAAASLDEAAAEAAASLAPAEAGAGLAPELDKLERFAGALKAMSSGLSQAVAACRDKARLAQQQLAACRQDNARKAAAADNNALLKVQAESRLEGLKSELDVLKRAWAEAAGSLTLETVEERFKEMQERDAKAEAVKDGLERSVPFLEEKKQAVQTLETQLRDTEKQLIQWDSQHQGKQELLQEKTARLKAWTGDRPAEQLLQECRQQLSALKDSAARTRELCRQAEEAKQQAAREAAVAAQAAESAAEHAKAAEHRWATLLADSPFATAEGVLEASLTPEEAEQAAVRVREHREGQREWTLRLKDIETKLAGALFSEEEWQECCRTLEECRRLDEEAIQLKARAERDLEDLRKRHERYMELETRRGELAAEAGRLSKLQSCLRGNAFVEYVAEEQLIQVSQSASQRLRFLTKQRYSLEVDSGGGFVIRDDANGGVKRPVSTLSGGETFLTSLSLALALSAQIQLRGQYPLQFFFLDEGFGTLDPELLDTVITSLERLHSDKLTVGIISHVPELRARLPRKLVVRPAGDSGSGSQIVLEKM